MDLFNLIVSQLFEFIESGLLGQGSLGLDDFLGGGNRFSEVFSLGLVFTGTLEGLVLLTEITGSVFGH